MANNNKSNNKDNNAPKHSPWDYLLGYLFYCSLYFGISLLFYFLSGQEIRWPDLIVKSLLLGGAITAFFIWRERKQR